MYTAVHNVPDFYRGVVAGTDTVLKTKLFGLKVRHFKTVSVPVTTVLQSAFHSPVR